MAEKGFAAAIAPHLHSEQTIKRGMTDVLIALIPVVLWGIIAFGINVLLIIVISCLTAIVSEVVMRKILGRKITLRDWSAVLTGLLLALTLPPTVPWWVVIVGSVIAVAIAKELFGGLGRNIFNPALFARVILLFSPFTIYTTKFVRPFWWKTGGFWTLAQTSINDSVAGRVVYTGWTGNAINSLTTSATPLSLLKSGRMLGTAVTGATPVGANFLTSTGKPQLWAMFLGFKAGAIGEVSVLALLLGGIYLVYRGTIDWRIPVGIIGAVFILTWIGGSSPVYQMLGGGLFLGSFFMATDWVTSPITRQGKWIYAVGIGATIAIFRLVSALPEGVAISILYWNVITLLIDRYVARPHFGDATRPVFNRLPKLAARPLPVKREA